MIVNPEMLQQPHVKETQKLRDRNQFTTLIGNTPLLDVSQLSPDPERVKIFAKAEWFNPGFSVKDRAAYNIIRTALSNGLLTKGKRILDSSSGNTAVAYALIGKSLGIGVTLFVPENVSDFQKTVLRGYGAEVIYTSAQEGSDGAIKEALKLAEQKPELYFFADQYGNPANWQAHYNTTGLEIWRQTEGKITHFIAGLGTSGTFMGTTRRLRQLNPNIQFYSMQPDSPFHGLEGLKYMPTAIVPPIFDEKLADKNLEISTENAQHAVTRLAEELGLLVGFSAGAAMAAALETATALKEGMVVTVFPDSAQRYFSDAFWAAKA